MEKEAEWEKIKLAMVDLWGLITIRVKERDKRYFELRYNCLVCERHEKYFQSLLLMKLSLKLA